MSALLEVRDLCVRFRGLRSPLSALLRRGPRAVDVLLDVSFDLRRGETLALVGESGSGKTTLGRALNGLVPLRSGSLRFRGEALTGSSPAALKQRRRRMAMMFQDPIASLSPRQSVLSLVTEPFVIHGEQPPAGETLQAVGLRLLDQVGLPAQLAGRYPHELSGGQARRVGVARALALMPDLVIADEPTAGLDVSIQGATLNLLTGLRRDLGLSLLLITHNLAVVRHVADRIAVLYLGRIVEIGRTADILASPAHPYTRALIEAQPARHRAFAEIPRGEVPSLRQRPPGCEFHQRCPLAQDLCRQALPALRDLGGGRQSRCHFAPTA